MNDKIDVPSRTIWSRLMATHPRLPHDFSDEMIPDLIKLLDMLTYCRPHGSKTERQFIKDFIIPTGAKMDTYGNFYHTVGDAPVLWSSHTDTVHDKKGLQRIAMTTKEFCLGQGSPSSCLGADDTAGVWLMLEMIKAEVPGLYVFHRNEERGRVGSIHFAKESKALVEKCHMAIALDRRGQTSVITHQMSSRCCSDDFGNSLKEALDIGLRLDSYGSYTDTASYTGLVGECTNLSVGYSCAHSRAEALNFEFLFKLRDKLCMLDTSKLVIKRKPGEVDPKDDKWDDWGYGQWGAYGGGYEHYNGNYGHNSGANGSTRWHRGNSNHSKPYQYKGSSYVAPNSKPNGTKNTPTSMKEYLTSSEKTRELTDKDFISLCRRYPDIAADVLEQYGVDVKEFQTLIAISYYNSNLPS